MSANLTRQREWGRPRRPSSRAAALLVSVAAAVFSAGMIPAASAQGFRGGFRSVEPPVRATKDQHAEFYFTRLAYRSATDSSGFYRRRQTWTIDFPESEIHFLQGIGRLTRVNHDDKGVYVDLNSDDLMDYPWLYAVEVGHWTLNDAEAARLREYLLRGGFLMVDDFWGSQEWSVFIRSMKRVFPNRPIVEIGEDNELLHVVYDLNERIQIPGVSYIYDHVTWQKDGYVPHWRGIYDDKGRLMVGINFNMDMGDAWEHADNPLYPEPMTALAYRFAVNYVVYSMSH